MAKQEESGASAAGSSGGKAGETPSGKSQDKDKTPQASAGGMSVGSASSGAAEGNAKGDAGSSTIGSQAANGGAQAGKAQTQGTDGQDAVALLKADHRRVETLFADYEKADEGRKAQLIAQICNELILHTRLEEEIFYPACLEAAQEEAPLDEAQVEHDSAKVLIADLLQADPDDDFRDAKVKVLSEQIKHHVAEEEKSGSGIFAKAKANGVDLTELGRRLQRRKTELQGRGRLQPTPLVSIEGASQSQQTQEEDYYMARNQDDDRRYGGQARGQNGGGYSSRGRDGEDGRGWYGDPEGHSQASRRGWAERRGEEPRSFSRYEDDDDRSYRGRSSQGRDRDEYGRFTSDDDDRGGRSGGGRSSASGRDRDDYGRFTSDDDDRGGGRSRGGRASASGRDRDEYGRFTSDDDDDRGGGRSRGGRSSSSGQDRDQYGRFMSDDDDRDGGRSRGDRSSNSGRDRDEYGRFMSDDDDDRGYRSRGRGQGGWFGDSEGHAEAARRGWEERGDYRSRGRDDDDDRGGRSRGGSSGGGGRSSGGGRSGGRGQGGWFGDSEGHAEAARRGWEDRR